MLKIRLQRIGKRGQAYFRVVVAEHTKKPKGEFLELLGSYNPHEKKFSIKRERAEHWMSKGAQISPTVNNLMVNYKIWDRPKMASWKPKKVKGEQPKSEGAAAETQTAETPAKTAETSAEPAPQEAAPQ